MEGKENDQLKKNIGSTNSDSQTAQYEKESVEVEKQTLSNNQTQPSNAKATQDQQATDNSPPNVQPDQEKMPRKEGVDYLTAEDLPQDVRESLPGEAQQLFIAAYNSILENNGDKEMARQVAWQTIENNEHYERAEDGKWRRKMQVDSKHSPIQTTAS